MRFVDEDDEKEVLAKSHWARATTETLVKIGDLEEPYVALTDHGSEINLMAKNLYNKCKWPMDVDHGGGKQLIRRALCSLSKCEGNHRGCERRPKLLRPRDVILSPHPWTTLYYNCENGDKGFG